MRRRRSISSLGHRRPLPRQRPHRFTQLHTAKHFSPSLLPHERPGTNFSPNRFRPHPVVPIAQLRHHVSHNQRLVPGHQHSSEQILRLPTQSQSQPPPLFPTTPFMRLVSFVASRARSGRAAGFIEWRRTPDCAADVWHVLWRLQVLRERRRLLVALEGHTAELPCTVNGFH